MTNKQKLDELTEQLYELRRKREAVQIEIEKTTKIMPRVRGLVEVEPDGEYK